MNKKSLAMLLCIVMLLGMTYVSAETTGTDCAHENVYLHKEDLGAVGYEQYDDVYHYELREIAHYEYCADCRRSCKRMELRAA